MSTVATKTEVSVDRDELLNALLSVGGYAAKSHHVDQYRWLRLTVTADSAMFSASNGDVAASRYLSLSGPEMDILVPRRLIDVTKAMPSGATLKLTFGDGKVSVYGGKGTTRFKLGLSSQEPLGIDTGTRLDWSDAIVLTQRTLDAFAVASQFCGYDPSRPMLQNVQLKDGMMMSTDTHRMFCAKVDGIDLDDLAIPGSVIGQLNNFGAAQLMFNDSTVYGRNSDFFFRARRIDGAFPDLSTMIQNVLDTDGSFNVGVDADSLIDALNSVAVISSGPSQTISMKLGEGQLALDLTNQDGDAREEVSATDSRDLRVGFNLEQLRSGLKLFSGKKLTMTFVNELRPVVLSSPDATDETRFMIAPVRI